MGCMEIDMKKSQPVWLSIATISALFPLMLGGCSKAGAEAGTWSSQPFYEILERQDFSTFPMPGVVSEHFRSNYGEWDALGSDVFSMTYHEKNPATNKWYEISREFSNAFAITAMSDTPDGHNFVVAGVTSDGNAQLQLLSIPSRSGGVHIDVNRPTYPALGFPLGMYSAHEVLPVIFKIPSGRAATPTESRHRIYSGDGLEFVRAVELDPELRFALAVDLDGTVVQFDLTSGFPSTPNLIYDVSTNADLPGVRRIALRELANGGRVVILSPQVGPILMTQNKYVILEDSENDGLFESCISLTRAEFVSAGYNEPIVYSEMHRMGFDLGW